MEGRLHIQNLANFLRMRNLIYRFSTQDRTGLHEEGAVNIASSDPALTTLLFGPASLLHVHVAGGRLRKLAPVGIAAMARGVPWIATIHRATARPPAAGSAPPNGVASGACRGQKIICVNAAIRENSRT